MRLERANENGEVIRTGICIIWWLQAAGRTESVRVASLFMPNVSSCGCEFIVSTCTRDQSRLWLARINVDLLLWHVVSLPLNWFKGISTTTTYCEGLHRIRGWDRFTIWYGQMCCLLLALVFILSQYMFKSWPFSSRKCKIIWTNLINQCPFYSIFSAALVLIAA